MPIKVCVFDAYGTLFDVAAAARIAAAEPGRESIAKAWPRLAEDWRRKQLEYSWLRAVMGTHADFWQVTRTGSTGRSTPRAWPTRRCATGSWRFTGSFRPIPRFRPCLRH